MQTVFKIPKKSHKKGLLLLLLLVHIFLNRHVYRIRIHKEKEKK